MGFLQRSLMARLLVLFLLLSILPLAAIGYIVYDTGRQSIITNMEAHLESVAILKEQGIKNWVEYLGNTVTWLATDPHIARDAAILATRATSDPQYPTAHDFLVAELKKTEALGHLSPMFLLDHTSGQIIASSDITWEGQFRESEPYFTQGKNRTYVSDIFHSPSMGQPTMVISTPVKGSGGQLLAVIAAHANLEQLSELMLEQSGLGVTGETFLVNKSNLLITNTVFAPTGAFRKWIFAQGAKWALEGKSGVGLYLDYRGEPVIGAYRWLEDRELVLIAKQDQAEAFTPVNNLRNTIALVAGLVFILAAGVSVLLARFITHPLAKLADYARRVGKGEYTTELGVTGKDEVASVTADVKTMVEQMLQMQEKLLTAERLATLGQLSGSISHELRNPLGVIDSSVYYLKAKLKDTDEKVHEHIDRIKSSVGTATAIIESLLDLTRMKEPQLSRLDLTGMTHDAIVTSKVLATVNVVDKFPEQEVLVNTDREQLSMAFKNIINNAVEAMAGEGTLTVTVRRAADGQAEVSFADTGQGIPPEDLKRVFQPLFSTKAKGIGFGLSIARMVIDKHGGTIEAKSEPGKGAIIIMRLPLYADKDKEV